MTRIEIHITRAYRTSLYGRSSNPYQWHPSQKDVELVLWLGTNVGKCEHGSYKLPLRGRGWMIAEGYSEDAQIDDWDWRHLAGSAYQPKGKFGIWLEIEDDTHAALMKLSGILDGRQCSTVTI